MKIITSKTEITKIIKLLEDVYKSSTEDIFIKAINNFILKRKIKFPLLEFASLELIKFIPKDKQIFFLDKAVKLDEIGSYVVVGKILREILLHASRLQKCAA